MQLPCLCNTTNNLQTWKVNMGVGGVVCTLLYVLWGNKSENKAKVSKSEIKQSNIVFSGDKGKMRD